MMNLKGLMHTALICSSFIGSSAFIQTAYAETLVTCGPNGAASIVKVVPAGCRHLSATSAPNHSPTNPVKESRLGFTFKASAPEAQETQSVAVDQDAQNTKTVATLRPLLH